MKKIRVVLFDAVGTLLFPDPAVEVAYHSAGLSFGSRLSVSEVGHRFRISFKKHHPPEATSELVEQTRWSSVVADVFDDVVDPRGGLFTHLWEHFARPDAWGLFDDVTATWNELEDRRYQLAIASNFDSRLITICRSISPLDRSRHVFCSSHIGFPKPRREFFDAVQRRMGVSPEEILLVGDDEENDVSGARAAGWQSILIRRDTPLETPGTKNEGVPGWMPHAIESPAVSSLTSLLGLLPGSV